MAKGPRCDGGCRRRRLTAEYAPPPFEMERLQLCKPCFEKIVITTHWRPIARG